MNSEERTFDDGNGKSHTALDKAELRRRFLGIRKGMSAAEQAACSAAMCEHLRLWLIAEVAAGRLPHAGTVGLYAAMRGEANLRAFAVAVRETGWRTAYPKADKATREMAFHLVADEDALWTGAYGIQEPLAIAPIAAPRTLDLLLVPGVAFTQDGIRLGYGGGYYDRFLPALDDTIVMGVAFMNQLTDALPADAWDKPMHAILTERGIGWCR